ncbi:hypothetical protein C0995_002946 [Termitomyces sp. Mi166|nr:hypothetical protein C0995_002946 [Termitomyces sp. Mi166\
MLPKTIQYRREMENEDATRISHLVTLTKGLLPRADNGPISLSSRVRALIDNDNNEEEDNFFGLRMPRKPKMTLRQLRLSNIDADAHNHTWNGDRTGHQFEVGDYGYIPDGKRDFKDFIILGNIVKTEVTKFAVSNHAYGTHWFQESVASMPHGNTSMEPFPLPGDATCWTLIAIPYAESRCRIIQSSSFERVADAWRFLLLHGRDLAMKHDIKPEKLMLITQAGTDQDFYTRPRFLPPPSCHPVYQPFDFNNPGFNSPHSRMFQTRFPNNLVPVIVYLITSPTPGFEPYWSHKPVLVPQGTTRPDFDDHKYRAFWFGAEWPSDFIHWIQLHTEDFAE